MNDSTTSTTATISSLSEESNGSRPKPVEESSSSKLKSKSNGFFSIDSILASKKSDKSLLNKSLEEYEGIKPVSSETTTAFKTTQQDSSISSNSSSSSSSSSSSNSTVSSGSSFQKDWSLQNHFNKQMSNLSQFTNSKLFPNPYSSLPPHASFNPVLAGKLANNATSIDEFLRSLNKKIFFSSNSRQFSRQSDYQQSLFFTVS